jgi:hypothetical protein
MIPASAQLYPNKVLRAMAGMIPNQTPQAGNIMKAEIPTDACAFVPGIRSSEGWLNARFQRTNPCFLSSVERKMRYVGEADIRSMVETSLQRDSN